MVHFAPRKENPWKRGFNSRFLGAIAETPIYQQIVHLFTLTGVGLSAQWVRLSQRWKKPSKSSISEARQRVGPQVMSQLFQQVARPLATEQTPGAFLNGLRLMAVDGTAFDLPDTDANARVFGYPGTRGATGRCIM